MGTADRVRPSGRYHTEESSWEDPEKTGTGNAKMGPGNDSVIRERNQLKFELKQAQRLHQEAIRIIERKTAEPMVLREPPVTRSRPVSRMDDDKTPKKAGVLIRTESPRAHERGPRGLDASKNSAVHKKFRDGTGQATVSKCDFARPNTSQRQPIKRWDNALEGTRR